MSPENLRRLADRFDRAGEWEKAREARNRASDREAPAVLTDIKCALHLLPPGSVIPARGSRYWAS